MDASSGGEAKCLAIGPAAPPDDQLEANIAAAEIMNLTVDTSGAHGIASSAAGSPGAMTVVAFAMAFTILLLLTGP